MKLIQHRYTEKFMTSTVHIVLLIFLEINIKQSMSHSRKNRQQKASKNRMNRNNSFVFVEVAAFIPRLA